MIFDQKQWAEVGEGFEITDCVIQDDKQIYFVFNELQTDDTDDWPRKRFVVAYLDEPVDQRFYYAGYECFDHAFMAYGTHPRREMVVTDNCGTIYTYDPDRDDLEDPLDTTVPGTDGLAAAISRIVRIEGQLFAVGYARRIYRREGLNRWTLLSDIPVPESYADPAEPAFITGFNDMAGFSLDDMYAVGGYGDLWHFDGKTWQHIPFPTDEMLFSVCCAGDGKVYISSGLNNTLWVGRGTQWTRRLDAQMSLCFKDMVWFSGRLWCGNSYGVWFLRDDELVSVADEYSLRLASHCGRLDVSPDGSLMLTASPIGAAIFDGSHWEILFNKFDLE